MVVIYLTYTKHLLNQFNQQKYYTNLKNTIVIKLSQNNKIIYIVNFYIEKPVIFIIKLIENISFNLLNNYMLKFTFWYKPNICMSQILKLVS